VIAAAAFIRAEPSAFVTIWGYELLAAFPTSMSGGALFSACIPEISYSMILWGQVRLAFVRAVVHI